MAAESDSESSNLSASDWKKIRQLIDCAVNHKESRKISQLNRTIIKLSTQSQLVQRKNDFNKLSKLPKRVRRRAFKLVQNQNQKNLSFVIVVVVRSHQLAQQAHHRFNRDVGAISSCQPD
jgi:hypothetical protein